MSIATLNKGFRVERWDQENNSLHHREPTYSILACEGLRIQYYVGNPFAQQRGSCCQVRYMRRTWMGFLWGYIIRPCLTAVKLYWLPTAMLTFQQIGCLSCLGGGENILQRLETTSSNEKHGPSSQVPAVEITPIHLRTAQNCVGQGFSFENVPGLPNIGAWSWHAYEPCRNYIQDVWNQLLGFRALSKLVSRHAWNLELQFIQST